MKHTYDLLASERDLILLARGVAEVADTLALDGPGVKFARALTAAADAGQRGLSQEEREARKPGAVNLHDWPTPPPPPPKRTVGSL